MALNLTAAFLEAKIVTSLILFSKTVTTQSTYLAGAGGLAGDGQPMPFSGVVEKLSVYDESQIRTTNGTLAFDADDRFALYATYGTSTFTVTVVKNGIPESFEVANVAANTNLFAIMQIRMKEE